MQWDGSEGAGFTRGEPWLPLNEDFASRNVASQERDPASLLSWYKALIALRRSSEALRSGAIRFLDPGRDALARDVLAYERSAGEGRVLVLLNFASRARAVRLEAEARVLLGGSRPAGATLGPGPLELGPLECVISTIQ
jgi:glycosidase